MPDKLRKRPFDKSRSNAATYARALRKVAREVGRIIEGMEDMTLASSGRISEALRRYAEILDPWARKVAGAMVFEANRADARAWREASKEMGMAIRAEIASTATGQRMRELMAEQVTLIKSLPLEAAERVHQLVMAAQVNSARAKEIAEEINRSGEVTESRAVLIARTEVGRASTVLTQARAEAIGSEAYVWRTAHDSDVRPSHRKMEGKTVRWDDPPVLDGLRGHAGALPNCRCYPEPIIPDKL
jgi:SPP1 gp7 family putative phage head morphogenesis protein